MHPPPPDPFTHPYAPPGAAAAPADFFQDGIQGLGLPGATVPLYTENQVLLATFFGTALGGSIVLALNEYRLGRPLAAVVTVLLGALGAAAILGIAVVLPDGFPNAPFWIVPLLTLRWIAHLRQKERVIAHLSAGGKRGSSWVAFGIGMGSVVVVVVPIVAVLIAVELFSKS